MYYETLFMNVAAHEINDKIVCSSSVVHIFLDALTCEIRSDFCRLTLVPNVISEFSTQVILILSFHSSKVQKY